MPQTGTDVPKQGKGYKDAESAKKRKARREFFVMMVRGWHPELTCRTRCVYSFTNGNTLRPLRTSVFFASSLDSEKTGSDAGPRYCHSRCAPLPNSGQLALWQLLMHEKYRFPDLRRDGCLEPGELEISNKPRHVTFTE